MNVNVVTVSTEKQLNQFIKFPWTIYKGNKNWVPPLISDMKKKLKAKLDGSALFLALDGKKAVGRLLVSYDEKLNIKKNEKTGYFSLFECINDFTVAKALFDKGMAWLREQGINFVRGPFPIGGSDGDEYKGLLVNCFDEPPYIMNSYNPEYYQDLITKYGFRKDYDLFAYHLDKDKIFNEKTGKIIEYAKKKYNFEVYSMDFKKMDQEIRDLKEVLDLAVPDEWPDLVAPTLEEVQEMAKYLRKFADPDLIIIARSGNRPIGFGIALPNYNQVLSKINGRLTPIAIMKYLYYRRKIDSVRFFTMFVIPEFRSKGVSYAIYYQTFLNGTRKGYYIGEGSSIGEENLRMRNDIESFGGVHTKTYRIFCMEL